MKSLIGKGIIAAAAFYILLMGIEAMLHPQVAVAAVAGAVLFAVLATVFYWKNEHAVHMGEVIVLWAMVLLFAAYGFFFFIGGMFA